MLARKQTIVETAEVAVGQLQTEARYFDQLADQFPAYKRSLGKHATDCQQIAANIQKKFKHDSSEVLSASIRTANVFLAEGQRLRLKLRINLLQQETTGLELEAGRWAVFEPEFKSLAEECRQLVSICQTNISTGSSSEVEVSLTTATSLYEKSLKLRKQQKRVRRQDASARLLQKVELLNVQANQLQEKNNTHPSLSNKVTELSTHYLQAAVQLKEKAKQGTINDIEKAISATVHLIERLKLSQEVPADNVVAIRKILPVKVQSVDEDIQEDEIVELGVDASDHVGMPDHQEGTETGSKHISTTLMTGFVFLGVLLGKVLRKLFKLTEQIFMYLVVALVILIVVFVVTYLSGSGFSKIGLL